MRVLVLASTFPRWEGDAQPLFILDLCRHLPDCEIHVLVPGAAGAAAEEQLDNIRVHRYRYAPVAGWQRLAYGGGMLGNVRGNPLLLALLPFFLLAQVFALLRLQRRHRFDVVHAHWVIPQGLCAVLALALWPAASRPRLLVTAHGADVHVFAGRAGRLLKRLVLRRADGITAVSAALALQLRALGTGTTPLTIAPMGIELRAPRTVAVRAGFCFVGRFVEKKGIADLVEAYARARAEAGDALPPLMLAGDGPLRGYIEARIAALGLQRQVRLAGWLDRQAVTYLVAGSALLLMPSRRGADGDHEGLGLVAVEALALGTPVLAYNFAALADIKAFGGGVQAVTEGDVAALATAMLAQARQPQVVAAAVQEAVRAHFAWPAVGAGYRALYAQLSRD